MQNDKNVLGFFRRSICLFVGAIFIVTSLSACTTARKIGHGAKHAVKDGVEAVKEGGREVKRAIKEN